MKKITKLYLLFTFIIKKEIKHDMVLIVLIEL